MVNLSVLNSKFINLILVFTLFTGHAVSQQIINHSIRQDSLMPDTRRDNIGYWKKMIYLGLALSNAPIPVKPAEFKGTNINIKDAPVDSPDVPVSDGTDITLSENSIDVSVSGSPTLFNSNNSTDWDGTTADNVYGANYLFSYDEGVTWDGSFNGAGGDNDGDPVAVIGQDGRKFMGFIYNNGQAIAYSDNDIDWVRIVVAPNPGTYDLLDKNHLCIDKSARSPFEGNLYDAWVRFDAGHANDNEIELIRSTDNGASWSSPLNISTHVNAGGHNQGVNLQTGPLGEVYACWTIYDTWPANETAIGFTHSTDGGSAFGNSRRIISNIKGIRNSGAIKNMRVNSFPSMAVDISGGAYDGYIYIVWTNIGTPGINTGSNRSIYIIKSYNHGETWSEPVRVNQGPFGFSSVSFFPWITCDQVTGYLFVIFYDDRNTSASDCEAWVAVSEDGGEIWEDFRVSDVSFTPAPISGMATGYFGDYLGITANNSQVFPVWTDNRDGRAMSYISPFSYTPELPCEWEGSFSTEWSQPTNWIDLKMPDAGKDIIINNGAVNWPIISGDLEIGSGCRFLTMTGNSQITVTGDIIIPAGRKLECTGNNRIVLTGNFEEAGTFIPAGSTVEFIGLGESAISSSSISVPVITDNFSVFPGNWNGDIGTGYGQFKQNSTSYCGGATPEIRFRYITAVTTCRLYHDPFNTTGISSLNLSFNHFVNHGSESGTYTVKIEWSTNGTDWFDSDWFLSPSADVNPQPVTTVLTAGDHGVGSDTYYISFTVTGNLDDIDYWFFDDLSVSYISPHAVNFHNLSIAKENNIVLPECNLSISGDFTVLAQAWFTNPTFNSIHVSGNALFDSDESGMVSFINQGIFNVTGNTTVNQYLSSERWHLVSPPVSDAVIESYLDIYLKEFNEPDNSWTYLENPLTIPLNPAQGYSAWASDDLTGSTEVLFEGSLNSGNFVVTGLSYTPGSSAFGWNLLGNPYPSSLQWNDLWIKSNISEWACVHHNGNDACYNAATGTEWPNPGDMPDGIIPPTQGFWVRATSVDASLTIPQNQRIHGTHALYKNSSETVSAALRIRVDGSLGSDVFLLQFIPGSSAGYNPSFDLEKRWGYSSFPQIYSISDSGVFSVKALPEVSQGLSIPIGFETGAQDACTITVPELYGFDNSIKIRLRDNIEKVIVELTESANYQFNADPENNGHRFDLIFSNENMGCKSPEDHFNIYINDQTLVIENDRYLIGTITIYDLTGRIISENIPFNGKRTDMVLRTSCSGYIVAIKTGYRLTTRKVIVNRF